MTDNITEAQESKTNENRCNRRKLINTAALSGIAMSVTAVIVWFLFTDFMASVGTAIFITTVVLIAFNALIFLAIKKHHKLKIPVCVVLAILNAMLFISVTVYFLASSELFYPHFDEESYEALQTRPEAEELTVNTENGVISGWMLHNAEDSAPLVLYFYGNGENASTRTLKILDNGMTKTFSGCNIAIFDYPGYGKSEGTTSEKSMKSCALSAFDALAERGDVDKDHIILFGYSIGTGIADYVASKRDVSGLILMAPYADGYDLYNGYCDIFYGPMRLLVAFPMESAEFAENVSVCPLIMASTSDEMVNYNSSVRLSQAFSEGCIFKTFENTGHNDFWGSETAFEYIAEYLQEVNG